MIARRASTLLLTFIASACGGSPGNEQDDPSATSDSGASDETGATSDDDGVRVTVRDAQALGRIGELPSGPDHRFLILDVRVENQDFPTPIPVVFPLFALRTASGVEYLASEETLLLSGPCDGGIQIATGGSFECSLAFTIPHTDQAAALVYRPAAEVEVVVTFEAPTCEPCGDDCVDLLSNENHCGACFVSVGPDQTCQDGELSCGGGLTLCGDTCIDIQTNPNHCGACFAPVALSQTCHDGEPTCPPGTAWCNDMVCLDITDDDANCGACGKQCSPEATCSGGNCRIEVASNSTTMTCGDICGAEGLGCLGGSARYYGSLFCPGGGGGNGESNHLGIGCNMVPDPTYMLEYGNGCVFSGDVTGVECNCVEP